MAQPAPETEQPIYYIRRLGPTGRITFLASRRTNPLEHFWTKHRGNASIYYPDKADKILKEAPPLGNPYMSYAKVLVNAYLLC